MSKAQNKKIVLIGSSGTGNAFSSILALRRNWGDSVKIVAIDTNPRNLVTSSLLSDIYYQVPENCKPEFKDKVTEICSKENIDTYIPFIDEEIFAAAVLYEEKRLREDIGLQVRNSGIADLCNDKYKTYLWLSEEGILTPECYKSDNLPASPEQYILKPRKGFGTRLIKMSETNLKPGELNPEQYIIQYECEKPEITIDVCYDRERNYFNYVCRERIETKSGVCTKARLFYDDKLGRIAFQIAEKLELSAYCFQVMTMKGEWAVTDINPRLGAGTGMSLAAGMDFFSAMFAILWDEDPSVYFRSLDKEIFVTRLYSDFIMNL